MEQVKCPECGGTKCTALNNETYRCLYCGATIKVKSEEEVQQTVQQAPQSVAQQPQVVVQVQVPQQPVQPQYTQQPVQTQKVHNRSKGVAAILALLFGGVGGQFFYLGDIPVGVACILSCFTGIPALIGVICAIYYICMSDQEFDEKYNMK